jgi:threonine dehydrogenase-like Zn-dependent dehydrogenase
MCRTGSSNLCSKRTVFGMHRQGAFAEFVSAPARSLHDWPKGVEAASACLAEPLANGVHVANLVAHREPERVIIIGAGSIGLMCLQAIRNRFKDAICVVTDLVESRLEVADRLGAHATGRPDHEELSRQMARLAKRSTANLVVDAAGAAATKRLSLGLCSPGGLVVWIGLAQNTLPIDTYEITLTERSVIGSYGSTSADMDEALRLMATGAVDVSSWVTSYESEHWVDGFTRQLDPTTRDVKAVLVN